MGESFGSKKKTKRRWESRLIINLSGFWSMQDVFSTHELDWRIKASSRDSDELKNIQLIAWGLNHDLSDRLTRSINYYCKTISWNVANCKKKTHEWRFGEEKKQLMNEWIEERRKKLVNETSAKKLISVVWVCVYATLSDLKQRASLFEAQDLWHTFFNTK